MKKRGHEPKVSKAEAEWIERLRGIPFDVGYHIAAGREKAIRAAARKLGVRISIKQGHYPEWKVLWKLRS